MMPKPLRVAQLSFWFVHAEQFCLAAQEAPDVELVAAWDSDVERGSRRAAHYGVSFYDDLEELLKRDDIDAVSLCAEPFRHPDLVEAAAAAGKHMLIEKPMAANLEGASQIVRAVEDHGVQAMPAYNLRFHPVAQRVKDLVDAGTVGRIARVRRLHGHSLAYERGDFDARRIAELGNWGDPEAERRDSLFFAGSHSALWFQWMFGSPQSVQCMTNTVTSGLTVEDNSVVLLRYPDGFVGAMESSETLLVQETVTEIYGTEGVILQLRGNLPSTRVWNSAMTPLMVFRRSTEEWEIPALPPQFLRHERLYSSPGRFFDALLADEPVPTDVYDGYDSIAILAAADESASLRREVEVRSWPRARLDRRVRT
jgi:predicted dehydrogenase